ncbi:unnamed protein product [Pocillopora meandrina]|uniref:Uncharacterized protein n=1 Tax=Pocillopora meandrina TaxID=46732 RepID=A0AAU9VXD7_9CNID|nr:unnamed protein product [Pocillopora meandrina]
MSVGNRDSNDWAQRPITSNSSSSSLSSLPRSPVPERSGLMVGYAQREQREMRERDERGNREGMERELKERRERETRVREDRTAEESLSLQETPPWQCEHYQRRCRVKFPCCGVFYPCQHCHNLSGTCSADDRKAHDATHVKCGNCGLEEEINEESQTCRRCGVKLSKYFCPKCKHFIGVDKNPFHCEKCEICRFNKDTSFHCDVCNVCMEKRLEGKHPCRPDSGHEVCPICREEVFTNGRIMPCSHKFHKECVIGMKNRDIHNCPICGLSLYGQLPSNFPDSRNRGSKP